jgi:hypothetical protein
MPKGKPVYIVLKPSIQMKRDAKALGLTIKEFIQLQKEIYDGYKRKGVS